MNSQPHVQARRRRIALLAAALFVAVAVAASLDRSDTSAAHTPMIGDFTGEFTTGGPVYRLPPVQVVAGRKAALARIEREERLERAHREQLEHSGAAQAQTASKPTV